MASLLDIKKRIGSVKNTRKITKAMQLVAASKMQKFQKKAMSARGYMWDLLGLLEQYVGSDVQSDLTQKREHGKLLFVLYTSDKGLCGSLNGQLIRTLMKSDIWNNTPESDRMLITVGKKATEYARANDIPVEKSFRGLPEQLEMMDALEVIDALLEYWNSGDVREIQFVVPHYKNSFTFYPKLKTFLPFSVDMVETYLQEEEEFEAKEKPTHTTDFIYFEPSQERVFEMLYQQIVETAFIQSFLELKASEYSSRMIAMQSATDAAGKVIENLTRTYNKTRQQAITQQLSEIVAAGEAIQ